MASKEFRLPLAGSYTNRVSAVNALDTSSGYVGVGIVGVMIVGATSESTNKDQRFVNCFSETIVDAVTGQKTIYSVKRPGWGTNNTPSAGNVGNAIFVWTGGSGGIDAISSFGGTNSTIYNGTSSLGAITGKCTGISETFVSATATLTVSSTDSTGWYYDTGVAVMTRITDVDFPGNAGKTLAGTFAHLDGYPVIMTTDGVLWAGDLNTVTAWTSTSFGSANSYSDRGIGCVRHKNFIMAFGTESIEFFYNAGTTPFPFAKNQSMTVKVGAISADAIAQIADTTFWAGSTPQSGLSIFQYDNGINRISTPEIDSILILAGASNVSLTTLRVLGRSFVVVLASSTTLVYCLEEKSWHEWTGTTILWYKCAGVSIGGTMVNYCVSKASTSGKVYIQNQASLTFVDDSVAYSARAQLKLVDFGTQNRKFWEEVRLVCDVEPSSTATLSYTDDDYNTYTTHGTLDLSAPYPRATRLGSSRRRGWVVEHSSNTPFRAECLEGRASIGTG